MAAELQPMQPVLQKPPGYRDPANPAGKPIPPPPIRNNYPFRQRKRPSNCYRTCCCIFFIICLILLFIIVILAGVMYLWLQPKTPAFHLQSFKISKLAVAKKDDGTYIDAATLARMEIKNPNGKIAYRYGPSEAEISAGENGETELGSASLPAFRQRPRNATSVKFETSVKNEVIDDGIGAKLKSDFRSKNLVVNIRVKTKVGVVFMGFEFGMLSVEVCCDDIKLKEIEEGPMPRCEIRTFNWITVK